MYKKKCVKKMSKLLLKPVHFSATHVYALATGFQTVHFPHVVWNVRGLTQPLTAKRPENKRLPVLIVAKCIQKITANVPISSTN